MYFMAATTSSSVTVTTPSTFSLMTSQGNSLIVVNKASHIVSGGPGFGIILPIHLIYYFIDFSHCLYYSLFWSVFENRTNSYLHYLDMFIVCDSERERVRVSRCQDVNLGLDMFTCH